MTSAEGPEGSGSFEKLAMLDELQRQARSYIESMENICKKKEEIAYNKFQKELESLDSNKRTVDELLKTLEMTQNAAFNYDSQIAHIRQEKDLLENEILDQVRRNLQRKALFDNLQELNDNMIIPDEVTHGIVHGKVTEKLFERNLDVLNKLIENVTNGSERSQKHLDYPRCHFICVTMERLKTGALAKIATYVKQHALQFHLIITKCKLPSDLRYFHRHYKYLQANRPKIAEEVIDSYVRDKSDIYITYFKLLDDQVIKLCDEIKFTETEERHRIYLGTDAGDRDQDEIIERFVMGDRAKVLDHIAESDVSKRDGFYFEDVFKNYHIRLLDVLYKENAFLHSYFLADQRTRMDILARIMSRTVTFLSYSWKKYLGTMYDSITSFLCFHLVLRFERFCRENELETMDRYWETLERLLLYRFSHTIHMNVHSLAEYDASRYEFDFCAHYAVKRYAVYAAETARIHKSYGHAAVGELLDQLRDAIDDLCERVARTIPDPTHVMVFLINCCQQIIDAAAERYGDDFLCCVERYVKRLPDLAARYVAALIESYYGDMVRYLDEMEVHVATGDCEKVAERAPLAEALVDEFNGRYECDIDEIHRTVLMSFMNFITANGILEATLAAYSTLVVRFAAVLIGPQKRRLVSTVDVEMALQRQRVRL